MVGGQAGWAQWGHWVALLLGLLGACRARPLPDSSPLLQFGGQVRQRYLYTDDAQRTEMHLEIRADGSVGGAARRTPESKCAWWPCLREEAGGLNHGSRG